MAVRVTERPARLLVLALWCAVVLLGIVGVAAAIGRGAFPADLGSRVEPLRRQLLESLDRYDPFALQRAAELQHLDGRFGAHPVLTLLHVLPGGLFLALAPFQFSARVRSRHLRLHRWSGRVLMVLAFLAMIPAFYFGLLMPYGGPREALAIGLFGGLFVVAMTRAFVAIKGRQIARHREWMIRAFAIAIGISTVRVIGALLDVALTPAGFGPQDVFVLSVWSGWLATLGGAEAWIRYTRPRPPSELRVRPG